MKPMTSFIEQLDRLCSDVQTAHKRIIGRSSLTHRIVHPNIDVTAIYFQWNDTCMLTIADNTMFNFLPKYYSEITDDAKQVFQKLTQWYMRMDSQTISQLTADVKQAILSEIMNGNMPVTFKTVQASKTNRLEVISECKISENGITVEAYEDSATCWKIPSYYATIKTDGARPPFPDTYNTNKSGDYAFAKKLYEIMKSRVK